MRSKADYRIVWSEQEGAYFLMDDLNWMSRDKTHIWRLKGEQDVLFRGLFREHEYAVHFCSRQGFEVTLRKEFRQRKAHTHAYWYAVKRVGNRIRKKYIGAAENITFEALESVAQHLTVDIPEEAMKAQDRIENWSMEVEKWLWYQEYECQEREKKRQRQEHARKRDEMWEKRYRDRWRRLTPQEEEKEHQEYLHWFDEGDRVLRYQAKAVLDGLNPEMASTRLKDAIDKCSHRLAEYEEACSKWEIHNITWHNLHFAFDMLKSACWILQATIELENSSNEDFTNAFEFNPKLYQSLNVFGLSSLPDAQALKRLYRELARRYHPDLHPGDAECLRKMQEINEAHAVLEKVCA